MAVVFVSLLNNFIQASFGLPILLLQANVCLMTLSTGQIFFESWLMVFWLILLYRLVPKIFSSHLMFKMSHHQHLFTKICSLLVIVLVTLHNSTASKRTVFTSVLNILILFCRDNASGFQMCHRVLSCWFVSWHDHIYTTIFAECASKVSLLNIIIIFFLIYFFVHDIQKWLT